MSSRRRIPINVDPVHGEALDSWLEALAHRTQTSWGDLLSAVGLDGPASTRGLHPWMVSLTGDQHLALHEATGVELPTLTTMTLSHYEGRALAFSHRGALDCTFPWGPRAGTRYCPQCLAESGGRWPLAWRLGWTFACHKHCCLLVDSCPACHTRQRMRPRLAEAIPEPASCASPAQVRQSGFARCGADLTVTPVLTFADGDHPVLSSQRWIDRVLAGQPVATGIFANRSENNRDVLQAVRTIAVRVLTYAVPAELESIIPADLLEGYRRDHPLLPTVGKWSATRQLTARAPRPASLTAVGVLAALHSLECPDVQSAGAAMRWLITAMRARKAQPSTTNLLWTPGISRAVQLAAMGPTLKPSDQLRYRTVTTFPAMPNQKHAGAKQFARKVPTALWQNASLPLSIRGCHQRQLRPALSVALLLVGAPVRLDQGVRIMHSTIDGQGVSRVLQLLQKNPEWHDISCAVSALADHLAGIEIPIDYQRRRSLDYGSLLPDNAWLRICRETDTAPQGAARAVVARRYLQERISGSPAESDSITPDLRTKIADFPYYLTPELADALDEHAVGFLGSHDVHGEPVHYQPSADCLRGLRLPGAKPDDADIDALHHHVQAGLPLGRAAKLVNLDLEVARYLLIRYPTPAQPTGECGAYYRARHAYPRQRFIDQYEIRGKSLRDIADDAGVSRQTIARLADDYKIDLRTPGRSTKQEIERDWFYTEYVTHGRPLPDLAREQGVSPSTMARWARTYAIPLRPRGGSRKDATPAS